MSIFKRLDHVSIGVVDLEKARELFIDVLGGQPLKDVGANESEGFRWFTFLLGGKKVELVTPTTSG
ncbi:MAG TPA: VOC family protein, partial [Pirellulales bacterium]|nr:VOC family protein [Pirellulales bacterium]